jgi:hypothetical protein
MVPRLHILSPKRNKQLQTGWEGFFPYYAGFPELFARELLQSSPRDRPEIGGLHRFVNDRRALETG